MKLSEALIQRADCQRKISQIRQRLNRSAKVQESEQPPENPQALLEELELVISEVTTLIQQINRTNSNTSLASGTLSDALAERDALATRRSVLDSLIQEASISHNRYSRSEVRFVSTVDIAALQQQVNSVSQAYRLLDSQIQALNWQIDLLER